MLIALATIVVLCIQQTKATVYPLVESWHGVDFFNGFRFPPETYDNTTNGDTFWATAQNTSLLYTTPANTTILKVDNATVVPYLQKRYAPKLFSKTAYDIGTVWVMDAVHLPYGCSVWPAFWTQGPKWPEGGEIDIVEGVNGQKTNMIALHTANGSSCSTTNTTMTGNLGYPHCDNTLNYGSGCTVFDKNENSFGAGFAAAGGGVYIAEWAKEGIRVWFLTRSSVPDSLKREASSLDTSTLGTPVAVYSSSSCDVESLFGPQTLTINIALCGAFAGLPSQLEQGCALQGNATCYTTYVINDAAATYANAYFEINYINVYSSHPSPITTISSSTATPSPSQTATETTATAKKEATSVKSGKAGTWSTNPAGTLEGGATTYGLNWVLMGLGLLVGVGIDQL
ncbi:hypothetical protein L204_106033 [Cryptococcus depauperatus]|nr:hypothetical protein L204_05164 [Cryptococcus depauperatus CBS 7855]